MSNDYQWFEVQDASHKALCLMRAKNQNDAVYQAKHRGFHKALVAFIK